MSKKDQVDLSRRRTIQAIGASAVSVPALGITATQAQAEASKPGTAEDSASVAEVVVEPGTLNQQNDPEIKPDFVAIHSLADHVEPTLRLGSADPNGQPKTVSLPLDCSAKQASDSPASVVYSVDEQRYTINAESGQPVALNTTDGPREKRTERSGAFPAISHDARRRHRIPRYFSRAAWGGDNVEDLRFDDDGNDRWGSPPSFHDLQKITIHHSATENNDPDPAARVRAIYQFQTIERNFGDIGYNLLVDERGNIYEGRYSGSGFLPGTIVEFSDGKLRFKAVQGAHVGGFNSGNFGIALLGNFVDQEPTTEAIQSLTTILILMSTIYNLDPLGDGTYINPVNQAERDVANIVAHLDWAATECPGVLRDMLPEIRETVGSIRTRPVKALEK